MGRGEIYRRFRLDNLKARDNLKYVGIDRKIILKVNVTEGE